MQPGPIFPQQRSCLLACAAALCVSLAAFPALAVAEHPAPTPVRPHRGSAQPVHVSQKSYAVTPRGHRLAAKTATKPAPEKPSAKKSPAKPGAAGTRSKQPSESSAREVAPKGDSAHPAQSKRKKQRHEEPPADPPLMYKTKAGRHGHGPVLVRVHGRWVAREPAADAGRFAFAGPAPLRGSHDILVHQNLMADDEGLERIQDEDDLDRLRASHDLVDFDEDRSLLVNPELPWNRRCARVWTVQFAEDLAKAFYAKFSRPLEVTSAARSVAYQLRLTHVNGNAAGIDGEAASPHLTGQAIDVAKRGMTRAQLAWMRSRLAPLIETGEIDVEEEFKQACFHISVYRSYLPVTRALPKSELAQLGAKSGSTRTQPAAPVVREVVPQP